MEQRGLEAAFACWRKTGGAEDLGELLKAYRDRAYATALRITHSQADAEDVVQQAFIKLYSRREGLEDAAGFERSVFRAVVQCALDALRAKKRRARHESTGLLEGAVMPASAQAGPAGDYERTADVTAVRAAVAELPEDERVPVVLCYYQGLNAKDAAEAAGVPRSTFRYRLGQGLSHLRRALAGRGKQPSDGALLALFWQEGGARAPEALCARLDALLPGRSCAEIAALERGDAPASFMAPAASAAPQAGAVAAAALGLAAIWFFAWGRGAAPEAPLRVNQSMDPVPAASAREAGRKEGVPPAEVAARTPGERERDPDKEADMLGKKTGALILAGALLAPALAPAGEPNGDVAKAIAQIEARRAAKADAAAKAAANRKAWGEGVYPGQSSQGQNPNNGRQ